MLAACGVVASMPNITKGFVMQFIQRVIFSCLASCANFLELPAAAWQERQMSMCIYVAMSDQK